MPVRKRRPPLAPYLDSLSLPQAKAVRQVLEDAESLRGAPSKTSDLIAALDRLAPLIEGEQATVQFSFSDRALSVLKTAGELARQTGRSSISSSCLLFAFARSAGRLRDTSWFVMEMLNSTGAREQMFNQFLSDANRAAEMNFVEQVGHVSNSVLNILKSAADIAARVLKRGNTIHARHCFAAIVAGEDKRRPPWALHRLGIAGIDLMQVRKQFYLFVREAVPLEDERAWQAVLHIKATEIKNLKSEAPFDIRPNAPQIDNVKAPDMPSTMPEDSGQPESKLKVEDFIAGPSGFTPGVVRLGGSQRVSDQLNVSIWAERLADLIALRETKLPLAIGLFANWGSGKSHFMNLINQRLRQLSADSASASGDSPWCREIVSIHFSAWHYLDTNLWASMVSQIFEGLFRHLRPKGNQLEQVKMLLEKAAGATSRANEEVAIARSNTQRAQAELQHAKEQRQAKETLSAGFLQGLRTLIPDAKPEELTTYVTGLLGIEKSVDTIDELRTAAAEARSLRGRARAVWNTMTRREGAAWRAAWLVVALLVVPFIVKWVTPHVPVLREWISDKTGGILALIMTLASTLKVALKQSGEKLKWVEEWVTKAEAAQNAARGTPEMRTTQSNLNAAIAREEAAASQLAEAQAHEAALEQEARNLAPELLISRFVERRALSPDYREQLGLISLARRDFQELSDLFADTDAFGARVPKKDLAQIQQLSTAIDRIVLFIDDLDRCKPDKVVQVLEAVHLLLAFPLFAVVVGVDQRSLRISLQQQFPGLLESGGPRMPQIAEGEQQQATSLDYLEKIFHIPFQLPPMDEPGFETLIKHLTEPPASSPSSFVSGQSNVGAIGEQPTTPGNSAAGEIGLPIAPSAESQQQSVADTDSDAVLPDRNTAENPTNSAGDAPIVGSVPLHAWERDMLREFHMMIHTPRAAIRFLNTYRLVRSVIPREQWTEFRDKSEESRFVMLLLSCAAGYPSGARDWFATMRKGKLIAFLNDVSSEDIPFGWNIFKTAYKAVLPGFEPSAAAIVKWLDIVERFCF